MADGPATGDAAWADPVVVPDDLRDLQADIDAYHRELRAARRRRRRERLLGHVEWRRWSFPLGMISGALALAMLVFVVLALDGRAGRRSAPSAAPLASPRVAVGTQGGLMPDVPVTFADGRTRSIRSLRPALVALVPARCGCTPLLDHLAAEATEVQIDLVVVAPASPDAEVAALPGQLHRGRLVAAYDATGALASRYASHGVTALVVGRDGIVTYVKRDVTASTSLELPLQAALLVDSAPGS